MQCQWWTMDCTTTWGWTISVALQSQCLWQWFTAREGRTGVRRWLLWSWHWRRGAHLKKLCLGSKISFCSRGWNLKSFFTSFVVWFFFTMAPTEAEYIARLRNRQLSEENGSRPVDVSSFEEEFLGQYLAYYVFLCLLVRYAFNVGWVGYVHLFFVMHFKAGMVCGQQARMMAQRWQHVVKSVWDCLHCCLAFCVLCCVSLTLTLAPCLTHQDLEAEELWALSFFKQLWAMWKRPLIKSRFVGQNIFHTEVGYDKWYNKPKWCVFAISYNGKNYLLQLIVFIYFIYTVLTNFSWI